MACSVVATTIGIVLSVLFEALRFFQLVSRSSSSSGPSGARRRRCAPTRWAPPGRFGAVPLFAGTLLISSIAMLVAVPVGLISAIYLAEYASRESARLGEAAARDPRRHPDRRLRLLRRADRGPLMRGFGESLGLDVASRERARRRPRDGRHDHPLRVLAVRRHDHAVPQSAARRRLRAGRDALRDHQAGGAAAALPGIVGGVLLADSRAIGETMIVVMAAGLAANLTANPLEAVTTVTVQIVTLLVGDQEFDSPKTLAAFALGLVLFVVTLALNIDRAVRGPQVPGAV
jgi:phosphate transport system permease protein